MRVIFGITRNQIYVSIETSDANRLLHDGPKLLGWETYGAGDPEALHIILVEVRPEEQKGKLNVRVEGFRNERMGE
jgi:hypothetical protein